MWRSFSRAVKLADMNAAETKKRPPWIRLGLALAAIGGMTLDFTLSAAFGETLRRSPAHVHGWIVAAWVSFTIMVVGLLIFVSQQRFSLRTILLVMTLVAVVLGLAAYAVRG
jgi:hypothetical protein